jgi:hypothetical protein
MGGGEREGNGRGGSDGGSRRSRRWVGRATLCSSFFFSQIIFPIVTATATEDRGDSAAAVVSLQSLLGDCCLHGFTIAITATVGGVAKQLRSQTPLRYAKLEK